MSSNTLHLQRSASLLQQGLAGNADPHASQVSKSTKPTKPTKPHLAACMMAMSAALMLSACGSIKSILPADEVEQVSPGGPGAAAVAVGTKRTRITSRDIMLEWSTVRSDRVPYKTKKDLRSSPLERMLDEPDYTVSIKDIMSNAACRSCEAKPYHQMVVNASNRHGVPTSLIHAVIQKESSYNPAATSKRRARGLMQVTPATARFVGVTNSRHLYDPQTNIYTGTAYLKYLLASHDTVDEALAAYNAGPGNVRKYKGIPPFRETQRYVRDVKVLYATTSR